MRKHNNMDQTQYLIDSERTAAAVKLHHGLMTAKEVLHQSVDLVTQGMAADCMKRSLFYSDGKIEERMDKNTETLQKMYDAVAELPDDFVIPDDKINLLHAYLGIQSESGEITEEIINSILENRDVNVKNLEEESGDSFWYFAMLLRELQKKTSDRIIDFATTMFKNIAKLKERFPMRFTTENALNRDLFKEDEALKS